MYGIFVVIMLLLVVKSESAIDLFEIDTIIDFAKTIVKKEIEIVDALSDDKDSNSAISELLGRMNETDQNITKLVNSLKSIDFFFETIDEFRFDIHLDDPVLYTLGDVDEFIYRVTELYESYANVFKNQTNLSRKQLKKWIDAIAATKNGDLYMELDKMYSDIIASESNSTNSSFFHQLAVHFPNLTAERICDNRLSIQQRLFYFYHVIMAHQLRGFVMIVYGNTINAITTKTIDKSIYEKAEAQVVLSILEYMLATKSAMSGIPRNMDICDAKVRTTDTYASFAGFLQEILINLVDLPPQGKCREECWRISNVRVDSCTGKSNYCPERMCFGRLYGCWWIGSLYACELPANHTERRYEWLKPDDGQNFYGTDKSCESQDGSGVIRPADTFARKLGQWCTVCSCRCAELDRDSPALRAVSYRPQISAIEDNMVVVGVRIIQADRLMQIQIRQGKLTTNGHIDPATIVWKETEKMRYDGVNVPGGSFDIYNEEKHAWERLERNKDYGFLAYYEKSFHLDQVIIDDDYIMTGVRWNYVPNRSTMITQIEVHATKYDHKTGKLDPETSKWVTPQNMPNPPKEFYDRDRTQIETWGFDHPLKSPISFVNSEPNQWLHLETTSREKDAAQTTVPFFDTQLVETKPPLASSGLQLVHRSVEGYSGFLALRLITVDLSKVWTIQTNSDDVSKYKQSFSGELPYDLE